MSVKIFIDGESGTTGLGIRERLARLTDVAVLSLEATDRKSAQAKRDVLARVDLAVLCLPDEAARQTAALIEDMGDRGPRLLDASSAHRVESGWVYGFPELQKDQPALIAKARKVCNPGCYATGAIALLRPLVEAGLIPPDFPLVIHAVSGYSGGGRSMIAAYESGAAPPFESYALELDHKHIPEIERYAMLKRRPLFAPSVGNFRQGMLVNVPLHLDELPGAPDPADLESVLRTWYGDSRYVGVIAPEGGGRLEPEALNGTNGMELRVYGQAARRQAILTARLDNLGKGASGAAIQNIELMFALAG